MTRRHRDFGRASACCCRRAEAESISRSIIARPRVQNMPRDSSLAAFHAKISSPAADIFKRFEKMRPMPPAIICHARYIIAASFAAPSPHAMHSASAEVSSRRRQEIDMKKASRRFWHFHASHSPLRNFYKLNFSSPSMPMGRRPSYRLHFTLLTMFFETKTRRQPMSSAGAHVFQAPLLQHRA